MEIAEKAWYEEDSDADYEEDEGDALGLMEEPLYPNKKALRQEIKRVHKLIVNAAMKKSLIFWQRLIRDDQLIEALPLKSLRAACASRRIPKTGKRHDLIVAIEKSILDEEESLRLQELERIAEAEKQLEASGSVYVVGDNSNGQLGLKDYDPREEFTCILTL
eukprot:g8851.t1